MLIAQAILDKVGKIKNILNNHNNNQGVRILEENCLLQILFSFSRERNLSFKE